MKIRPGFEDVEVKLVQEGRKRGYRVSGPNGMTPPELQPSVTQILNVIDKSGALLGWARNQMGYKLEDLMRSAQHIPDRESPDFDEWLGEVIKQAKKAPEKTRDDAADFGHLMHAVIAKDQPAVTDTERMYLQAAEMFLEAEGLTPLVPELPVWHNIHRYAGTVDLVARDKQGAVVILDWKTGSRLSDNYAAQVAAYGKALLQMYTDVLPMRAMVVRVDKEGTTEYKEVNIESAFQTFLGAHHLWCELNGFGSAEKAVWL